MRVCTFAMALVVLAALDVTRSLGQERGPKPALELPQPFDPNPGHDERVERAREEYARQAEAQKEFLRATGRRAQEEGNRAFNQLIYLAGVAAAVVVGFVIAGFLLKPRAADEDRLRQEALAQWDKDGHPPP